MASTIVARASICNFLACTGGCVRSLLDVYARDQVSNLSARIKRWCRLFRMENLMISCTVWLHQDFWKEVRAPLALSKWVQAGEKLLFWSGIVVCADSYMQAPFSCRSSSKDGFWTEIQVWMHQYLPAQNASPIWKLLICRTLDASISDCPERVPSLKIVDQMHFYHQHNPLDNRFPDLLCCLASHCHHLLPFPYNYFFAV